MNEGFPAWGELVDGRFVEDRPKSAEEFDGVDELVKVDWFDHVGIDPELVTGHEILFFSGGSHDDHGDDFEFGVAFDLAEDFDAVDFGHFQIEKNHPGLVIGAMGKWATAVKVIEGLFAVTECDDGVGEAVAS